MEQARIFVEITIRHEHSICFSMTSVHHYILSRISHCSDVNHPMSEG
uniref:Uncharacterized protein n=1 Tax=Arundo donax TaxID=35708 RepID=A0A0A9A7N9_ARUDO